MARYLGYVARRSLVLGLIMLAGAAILSACVALPNQGAVVNPATYRTVAPDRLASMLAQKDFTFINVHIPYDGEIDKTDAFIPYNEVDKNLAKLPADKKAPIVLYCRSGHMSSLAAQDLAKRGYTNVSHLDGGMAAWQTAGYTIMDRQR